MKVRPIDAEKYMELLKEQYLHHKSFGNSQAEKAWQGAMQLLYDMPTLTPPNEWVSVYDRLPEPGERVLATDCGFVGEFYINKRGKWQRYNVNCSELLMALDILYWMPLPAPPGKDNNAPTKKPNEPMTLEQLREMDGEPVWVTPLGFWALVIAKHDERVKLISNDGEIVYADKEIELVGPVYRRPPEGEEDI